MRVKKSFHLFDYLYKNSNMKSKCKSGHFVAYHSIMHKADCLFADSEFLESEIKDKKENARGGYGNYYMPLLLMYICAIESFANTMGFFLIEDFEKDFDKLSIMAKLRLCYKELSLEYKPCQKELNVLNESIKLRNRWVHCKPSKEDFRTEWESNSFDDIHDVRSNLEIKTDKTFIKKIKDTVHQIIETLTSKALNNFPQNKELQNLLSGVFPTVCTKTGISIPIKIETVEKPHDTSK